MPDANDIHTAARWHRAASADQRRFMAHPRTAYAAAVLASAALAGPRPLPAQQPEIRVVAPVTVTSPGGAFLRGLLLPGWGHASIGSYGRGAFYFTAETATGFLLARTLRRLAIAKDSRDLKEARVREVLLAVGTNPDSVASLIDEDDGVVRARGLVLSRQQQLEDWIALAAFLLFLSGADAFVSAHLRNFPPPVAVEAAVGPGGSVELGLRVRVGSPRRRR